ncbi:UNVERIFIED_CONTAM: hypothetical protein GTU68_033062 [Idotea baltica]|nr:hypothetical protein [Idotea baltica]
MSTILEGDDSQRQSINWIEIDRYISIAGRDREVRRQLDKLLRWGSLKSTI